MVLLREEPDNSNGGGGYQGPHIEVQWRHVEAWGEPGGSGGLQPKMEHRMLIAVPLKVLVMVPVTEHEKV